MSTQPTHHGYAVNVKDDAHYRADHGTLTDEEVDAIWQNACELFWMSAQEIGEEHGFQHVYSEGRMGGWAAPSPQPDTENMWEHEVDAWVRDVFRPFERDIIAETEHYRSVFEEDLADAVASAAREPAEAAHWAARDVVTV